MHPECSRRHRRGDRASCSAPWVQQVLLALSLTGAFTAALLAGAIRAHSTTEPQVLSLEELELRSDAVAIAEVVGQRAEWVSGALQTVFELRVVRALKGATTPSMELVLPGGRARAPSGTPGVAGKIGVVEVRPDAMRLLVGMTAVFFLRASESAGAYRLVSGLQGCAPIVMHRGEARVHVPGGGPSFDLASVIRRLSPTAQP